MNKWTYRRLDTESQVKEVIEYNNRTQPFTVIDVETTGLNYHTDNITDIVISGNSETAYCFSPLFGKLLCNLTPTLVFHNFKFDIRMLGRIGCHFQSPFAYRDTLLIHHLYDENAEHSLDSIVQARYADSYKSNFWGTYRNFGDASPEVQLEYACKDVLYTHLLYRDLLGVLKDAGIPDSLVDHVHKLALAFYDTEVNGLNVDLDYLVKLGTELKPKIREFQEKMYTSVHSAAYAVQYDKWAKEIDKKWTPTGNKWKTLPLPDFNFDSSSQLCSMLYDKLRIEPQFNRKTRARTADDAALEKIKDKHPVIPMIQEYRGYQKVYTSFIEGTLERLHNGKIYPSFNINGTVTGRVSSSDPNLQQLPASGEWAKVRGIYIPNSVDDCILTCDYGQLEVVIAAHYSQDANLLKIVMEGASKHDITAQALRIDRKLAKTLNFAMQYQCTPWKVGGILGCSKEESEYIWNKYWETYAGEKRVIDECKQRVDAGEPIINLFGRQRHFPIHFEERWQKDAAYRQAYSSLIQGTGADLTHWSFYTTDDRWTHKALGKTLFEVHDELVGNVKKATWQDAACILKETMIESGVRVNLSVPLTVDCSGPLERWEK